jgi:HK97 family phage prohead protease
MKRQTKSFAFELKDVGDDGVFKGVASVYGNTDLQNDQVQRGAFTKTLAERGTEVPILWQHDQTMPIGLGTLTDSPDGLLITGKLDLDIAEGKRAYSGLKKGYIKGLSIGYDVVKSGYTTAGVRQLKELKLYEVSTVTFPANEDATVTSVKAFDIKAFDIKSFALPIALECNVAGLLTKAAASLQDRMSGAYRAVREAYPLSNAYPLSGEIYDDYLIVCVGYDSDDLYRIAITEWDDDGEPTLGDAVAVQRTYVPINAADEEDGEAATGAGETKAGRVISNGNTEKLKAAADHMTKAAAHVADVIASGAPKKPAAPKKSLTGTSREAAVVPGTPNGAADPATEPDDLVSTLRASIDSMRSLIH